MWNNIQSVTKLSRLSAAVHIWLMALSYHCPYQLLITFIIVSPFFAMRPRCAFAAWITTRNNMNHKTHNGNGTIAGDNNHNTRQQHCIASFVNLSVPRLAKSQNKKSVRTWFTCELVCFFNTVFFLAFSVCLRIRCTLNRIEWTEL